MPIGRLFSKYIKRIVIAFVFWSGIYELYYAASGRIHLNLAGHFINALMGPTHLWFLFMIAGLYVMTPFLRKIAESKDLCEYFFAIYLVIKLLATFGEYIPVLGSVIEADLGKAYLFFVLGFSVDFLFGYYAKAYPIPKSREWIVYISGAAILLGSLVGNACLEIAGAENLELFTKTDSPTMFLCACAFYVLFVNRVSKIRFSQNAADLIERFGKYGFGMYLVHYLIVWILPVRLLAFVPILSTPIAAAVVFLISFLVSACLRRIPVLGRYIA